MGNFIYPGFYFKNNGTVKIGKKQILSHDVQCCSIARPMYRLKVYCRSYADELGDTSRNLIPSTLANHRGVN